MAKKRQDWMPRTIEGKLNMAKKWADILKKNATAWKIPPAEVTDFNVKLENAMESQEAALSPDSTQTIRKHRDRMVAELAVAMRSMKRHHFLRPTLETEDFYSLDLTPPDDIRTNHVIVTEEVEFIIEIKPKK